MANQKSDFEYLKWILNHDFLCEDKERMKELKEVKDKSAQIVQIRKGYGVSDYELYEFGSKENFRLLPFFNRTNNHPKLPDAPSHLIAFCDYIILAEFKNSLYIILVEMKRGETAHAKIQLQASRMFMDYVLQSAERIKNHNSMENFDSRKVNFRRIVLSYTTKETLNSHFPKNDKKGYAPDKNDIINYETSNYFDIREVI